jgi:hypothetical protein
MLNLSGEFSKVNSRQKKYYRNDIIKGRDFDFGLRSEVILI